MMQSTLWWQEDMERMRREQQPDKHDPQQPTLWLPIPTHPLWDKDPCQSDAHDDEVEPQWGVYIIDM